jgi:hypothetical protein
MTTLVSMINRFKQIDTSAIAITSIVETKEAIANLNAEQMFSGLRSDGSEILPSYTDYTIELKKAKGQPADRVTLRDTGSFYENIKVEVIGDKININSTDEKAEKLNKKYSKAKGKIFGLSDRYKREYLNESLRKVFKKKIENATGLKMK